MKVAKIPKWALITAAAGLGYLLFNQSGQVRRDVFRASQQLTERTGGRIPTVPRTVLPEQNADARFGVGFDTDFGLQPGYAFPPLTTAHVMPGFGVSLPPL